MVDTYLELKIKIAVLHTDDFVTRVQSVKDPVSTVTSATENVKENLVVIGSKLSEYKPNKFVCGLLVGALSLHLFYVIQTRITKRRKPIRTVSNVCTQCNNSPEPIEERSDLEVVPSENIITTPRKHYPRRRMRTRSAGNGQYCFATERPRVIVIN